MIRATGGRTRVLECSPSSLPQHPCVMVMLRTATRVNASRIARPPNQPMITVPSGGSATQATRRPRTGMLQIREQ